MDDHHTYTASRYYGCLSWRIDCFIPKREEGEYEMRVILDYDEGFLTTGSTRRRYIACDLATSKSVSGYKRIHSFNPNDEKYTTESEWIPVIGGEECGYAEVSVLADSAPYRPIVSDTQYNGIEVTLEIRRKK